jgi:hypothetical protein
LSCNISDPQLVFELLLILDLVKNCFDNRRA